MAVNPNFTNANANTSYFSLVGSGGGGNVSTINTLFTSTINFTSAVGGSLTTYPAVGNSPGGVVVGLSNATEPLTVASLCFGDSNVGDSTYRTSILNTTGLSVQGLGSGTQWPMVQFNSQTANSGGDPQANNETLSMFRLSTIGVAVGNLPNGQQINMVGLASTLKSIYPSIVL